MSLTLDLGSKPAGTLATAGGGYLHVGNISISYADFCEIVKYVLTNEDLREDDPRVQLVHAIKSSMTIEESRMGGPACRLALPGWP